MSRQYNFNSIGDLLDYRIYLKSEISRCVGNFYYSSYVLCCIKTLELVNYLIKKKGYNV